jgi:uncharacterized protein YjbJ (UPF0337 family)
MNEVQVKGTVKEAAGKIQGKLGDLVGNNEQQGKGLVNEALGKAQKRIGDAKEVMADARKKM